MQFLFNQGLGLPKTKKYLKERLYCWDGDRGI